MDILNEVENYVEGEFIQPDTKHTEDSSYELQVEDIKQTENELEALRALSDSMHFPQIDHQQKRAHEFFINDQKKKSKKKVSKNKKAMIKKSKKQNRKKKK